MDDDATFPALEYFWEPAVGESITEIAEVERF